MKRIIITAAIIGSSLFIAAPANAQDDTHQRDCEAALAAGVVPDDCDDVVLSKLAALSADASRLLVDAQTQAGLLAVERAAHQETRMELDSSQKREAWLRYRIAQKDLKLADLRDTIRDLRDN